MINTTLLVMVIRINEDKNITTKCVINARPANEGEIANSGGIDDAVGLANKQGLKQPSYHIISRFFKANHGHKDC